MKARCPQGHVFIVAPSPSMCGKKTGNLVWHKCPFCKMPYTKDDLVLVEASGLIHPGWKSVEIAKKKLNEVIK